MPKSLRACPHCGGAVGSDDTWCRACGHHLAELTPLPSPSRLWPRLGLIVAVVLLAAAGTGVYRVQHSGETSSIVAADPTGATAEAARTNREATASTSTDLRTATPVSSLPSGIPRQAIRARMRGALDGGTVEVSIGKTRYIVDLLGVFPGTNGTPTSCFDGRSVERILAVVPVGSTVYLEPDRGESMSGARIRRFVWYIAEPGGKAIMLNERLIADGYATFAASASTDLHAERLKKAEETAQKDHRGRWQSCETSGNVES